MANRLSLLTLVRNLRKPEWVSAMCSSDLSKTWRDWLDGERLVYAYCTRSCSLRLPEGIHVLVELSIDFRTGRAIIMP